MAVAAIRRDKDSVPRTCGESTGVRPRGAAMHHALPKVTTLWDLRGKGGTYRDDGGGNEGHTTGVERGHVQPRLLR